MYCLYMHVSVCIFRHVFKIYIQYIQYIQYIHTCIYSQYMQYIHIHTKTLFMLIHAIHTYTSNTYKYIQILTYIHIQANTHDTYSTYQYIPFCFHNAVHTCTSIYMQYILIHTNTFEYNLSCISKYLCVPQVFLTIIHSYTYQYIQIQSMMYLNV